MNAYPERILAVDLPSGLNPDTGQAGPNCVTAHATLCLLTLKPGLFTAGGRDTCGQIWLDRLDRLEGSLDASLGGATAVAQPTAWLASAPSIKPRRHASHKGSYGDVAVMGGAPGMTGAALLAATTALQCGAGRVFVALLDAVGLAVDTQHPELMFRPAETLDLIGKVVVLGCGGSERIKPHINRVLEALVPVVIDADAINSIAKDRQLQMQLQVRADRNLDTVLTPHPLEAARLLGWTTAQVQEDRLKAAATLATQFLCTVVLKGSGTVIARPGVAPTINPTGNAALATAGTGDVLAGMIGAALAQSWRSRIDGEPTGNDAFNCACAAVYLHGQCADAWLANNVNNPQLTGSAKLTASQLVNWLNPGLQMASW